MNTQQTTEVAARTIWSGADARVCAKVARRPDGGLIFSYVPFMHVSHGLCRFTLWCEVGEKYRAAFKDFFYCYALASEPIKLAESPWLCDRLAT